jgi:BirA family biotin operon repressor/biotin-[acetyl-CoA-carboxylase] ligase
MTSWPAGVGREIHPELDSTNAESLRQAAAGAVGPAWICARRQTAARGRRGRAWAMAEGNFAASLLMRPAAINGVALAQRSFVAALGLLDAMVAVTGRPELFALKWPNDVLLAGGKVAGILLETGGPAGRPPVLVIGIGVNLAIAPEAAELEPGAVPPASLRGATGIAIGPEDFLDLLAPAVDAWEERLSDEGFAPLRSAWLTRASRIGEEITARLPDRAITGRFETIDATGALVLATDGGRVVLPAADIHFQSRAEAPHAAGH